MHAFAAVHWIILVVAGIIGSVTLETGIARGTSTILARAKSWLEAAWVAVNWVLTTTG